MSPRKNPPPWEWDEYPPARPIRVEGGLVARSTRGAIGQRWWSRRFLEVMESMQLGGRLTRGRTYARQGQVVSLEVEAGEVSAVVQGSRARPYQVTIGLPRFTGLVWAKAEVVLAEQAIHSARLLAGEFPPELEPVFARIGAPLFPTAITDLAMTCSCPDDVVPCKHLAAAFYLLAERFDDDPFLILRWRGRTREALLERLRELRHDDPAPTRPGSAEGGSAGGGSVSDSGGGSGQELSAEGQVPGALAALEGFEAHQRGDDAAVFWTAGDVPALPAAAPLPVDFLLRQLPAPAAGLGGDRLVAELAGLYEAMGELPEP